MHRRRSTTSTKGRSADATSRSTRRGPSRPAAVAAVAVTAAAADRVVVRNRAGNVTQRFDGAARKAAPRAKPGTSQPPERRGVSTTGRIAKLLVGQGHGFIRLTDHREIFFHRSDVREGTSFNDFAVNDVVTFELLEDAVSGARALRVTRRSRR